MNRWIDCVAESPKGRMFATLVGSVIFSIVSGVYTNVITPEPNVKFEWSKLYTGGHFILLVIAFLLWIYVHWRFLLHDENIMKFADNQHCVAFIRKAKLEAYAKQIRESPEDAGLVDVKDFMKQLGIKP